MNALRLVLLLLAGLTAWMALAPPAAVDREQVRRQVARVAMTPAETAWLGVHWVTDLSQALELARRTRRPVFLMANDGRIDLGRC